jgi:hypothetical protein
MMYYYEPPELWTMNHGKIYTCDHPLYRRATLYLDHDQGLCIVQQRFNSAQKIFWWGPIDPWLVDDIFNHPEFLGWFSKHCGNCKDGLYPTYPVRKVMWALRMKPLEKQAWETASRELQCL